MQGSRLFLPVFVQGALFEIGDGHAARGNGKVGITAIETSLLGTLQFIVHKAKAYRWPGAETATHLITMGCDGELPATTRIAVWEMIRYLQEEKGLSRAAAYALCRVAVDLNITHLVDGNGGVHAMLPKDLFK